MKKQGGLRRKTRSIFTKYEGGNVALTKFMQSFNEGDKVALLVEPSYQKGMYHPMFYGRIGVVSAKKGRCYEVTVRDGGKYKSLIVHPVHLKRIENVSNK